MVMYEIQDILEGASSSDLYIIALKMLDDQFNDLVDLPDSIQNIEKIKSVCDTISKTKKKNISSAQCYVLRAFVSNNIGIYGDTTTKKDVINLFDKLRIESRQYL